MTEWKRGQVVRATRGREAGRLLCVVGTAETHVLVCDGRERPLSRPKAKNPKHLEPLARLLSAEEMRSDRALKQTLKKISEAKANVEAGHDRN